MSDPVHFETPGREYQFFYEGLAAHELRIQRCDDCGGLRNPPLPCCPSCRSLNWTAKKTCGRGTIYSYTIHHHPPLPGFSLPHPMGVVALEEGVRFFAAFDGIPLERVAIGLRVTAEFVQRGDTAGIRFREDAGVGSSR